MRRSILCACVAAAGAAAAIAARAEAPALNVKTGLWEMTMRQSGPPIPDDALARLPPEQRAKVQAMLGAAAQPQIVKTCLTKAKLARGPFGPENKHGCTQTVVTDTASALDVRVECKLEQGAVSGSMHLEAPTPERLKGSSVVAGPNRGAMTRTVEGRWLGGDCGGAQ